MAKPLQTDGLWERIEPLLPPLKERRFRVCRSRDGVQLLRQRPLDRHLDEPLRLLDRIPESALSEAAFPDNVPVIPPERSASHACDC